MLFRNTNLKSETVSFETALLKGLGSDFGLYTIPREEVPQFDEAFFNDMDRLSYSEIAFEVINQFIGDEISENDLKQILDSAYDPKIIPTRVENLVGRTNIMWLTDGPTYSFKDYAARFFGRTLDYFLGKRGEKRVVIVATSGDTGGAVADALCGLNNVSNIVFYPKGLVSDNQRRQMTTLENNVYAFEVNGNFDVCQSLAKSLLSDTEFAREVFKDSERFTSANSISIGRLLPQAVYPFYAYSRINHKQNEPMIASIPSGNFGDMMGTVIAKEMGLPISKIVVGVNENTEFSDYLESGSYKVNASVNSPSSAMIVSHPSNLARLVDFYGGWMKDLRDEKGKILEEGFMAHSPNISEMRHDLFSVSIKNQQHYEAIKEVYDEFGVILEPHGAVGYKALDIYLRGDHQDKLSVIYETADPGKFPEDIEKAIGIRPSIPDGMIRQAKLHERIYTIDSSPISTSSGLKVSDEQILETKSRIKFIFRE